MIVLCSCSSCSVMYLRMWPKVISDWEVPMASITSWGESRFSLAITFKICKKKTVFYN